MIIEWCPSPKWCDGVGKPIFRERRDDLFAGRKMKRSFHIPSDAVCEAFRQMGEPVARIALARTIANNQNAAGCEARRQLFEEPSLIVRAEIMEQVEEDAVAGLRNRFADVVLEKFQIGVSAARDCPGAGDLPSISVEPADWREKIALS